MKTFGNCKFKVSPAYEESKKLLKEWEDATVWILPEGEYHSVTGRKQKDDEITDYKVQAMQLSDLILAAQTVAREDQKQKDVEIVREFSRESLCGNCEAPLYLGILAEKILNPKAQQDVFDNK